MAYRKYLASGLTALNATETTATDIATITLPATTTGIEGFWVYANAGAGITNVENRSGIFQLTSEDAGNLVVTVPLELIVGLTSGAAAFHSKVWPLDFPVAGQWKITGSVTMDLAQTINPSARFGLITINA